MKLRDQVRILSDENKDLRRRVQLLERLLEKSGTKVPKKAVAARDFETVDGMRQAARAIVAGTPLYTVFANVGIEKGSEVLRSFLKAVYWRWCFSQKSKGNRHVREAIHAGGLRKLLTEDRDQWNVIVSMPIELFEVHQQQPNGQLRLPVAMPTPLKKDLQAS